MDDLPQGSGLLRGLPLLLSKRMPVLQKRDGQVTALPLLSGKKTSHSHKLTPQ